MRRLAAAALLISSLAASSAAAQTDDTFERGLFRGKAEAAGDRDRARTPVELKVKGNRGRAVKLVFLFGCDPAAPVRRVVATRFVKLRVRGKGAKGFFTGKFGDPAGGPKLDLTLRFRVEGRSLEGSAEAVVFVNKLACTDAVEFEAKLRKKKTTRR